MDNVRRKGWFSITGYILSSLCVLSLIVLIAEIFYPNKSSEFIPRDLDPISRWLFKQDSLQNAKNSAAAKNALQSQLFLPLNKKLSAGQTELVYRGLAGRSDFKIDLIIPQLDPQVAYHYRFNIKAAKRSFRLSNRDYKLVYAKKGALLLKQIN